MREIGSRIWMDGAFCDADTAQVAITDRGFTLGDGLFETLLWTGSDIRFFEDHMARLMSSAAAIGIDLGMSTSTLKRALTNLSADARGEKAVLRLTVTRGCGPRGLKIPTPATPMIIATIAPHMVATSPVILKSVDVTRHAGAPSSRFKTLSYIDNIMALRQACQRGGDDALMLGTTGYVACASSANLIVHIQGTNLTPALEDGALPGVVRGRLIKAGLVEEARLSLTHLAKWQGGVLTNALIGVRAISQIDDQNYTGEAHWTDSLIECLCEPS